MFCQVPRTKATLIATAKSAGIFHCPQPNTKVPQPSTQAFPTKGNSSKNAKKKEHNVDKREMLQTLQNELKSLGAQLVNLKGKSSQLTSYAQLIQGSMSREGHPRLFYGLSHDAMVKEYVLSSAHNSILATKFAISFYPSYFVAQEASLAPKSATRQVIQTDGFTIGSSPITRVKRARIVMAQYFCLLNTKEKCTLLTRGEEITTPQDVKASNSRVQGYMYIMKTHNFPPINLWTTNFKCVKWCKSL